MTASAEARMHYADEQMRIGKMQMESRDPAWIPLARGLRVYRKLGARSQLSIAALLLIEDSLTHDLPLKVSHDLVSVAHELNLPSAKIALSEVALANSLFTDRDFTRCFVHIDQAKKLAVIAKDKQIVARCHALKATVKGFRGDIRAIPEYREAARLFSETGDRASEAVARANLGGWLFETGKHEEAYSTLELALKRAREAEPALSDLHGFMRNRDIIGECKAILADINRRLGRPNQSLKLFNEARRESTMGLTPGRAWMMLVDMAEVHADIGNDVEAEKYFELALPPFEPTTNEVWFDSRVRLGYGKYLSRTGRHRGALLLFNQALVIARKNRTFVHQADSLLRMAEAEVSIKQPRQALVHLNESLMIINQYVPIAELRWRAHHEKGRALAAMRRNDEALREYEKAIQIIKEWLRGIPHTPDNPVTTEPTLWTPYHDALLAYLRKENLRRAFTLSEEAKGGMISLISKKGETVKDLPKNERDTEARLRERVVYQRYAAFDGPTGIADNARALKKAEEQYDSFRQSLYRRHPEITTARGDLIPCTLSQAQETARLMKTTILDYVLTDTEALVFIIDNLGTTVIQLEESAQNIKRLAEHALSTYYHDPQRSNRSARYSSASFDLYRALFPYKVERRLKDTRSLYIIPDDILWSVPFEMLWRMERTGIKRYLIEQYRICYAASVSTLCVLAKKQDQNIVGKSPTNKTLGISLAVLGNPQFPSSGRRQDVFRGSFYPHIITQELKDLRRLFGQRARIYEGKLATKDTARRSLENFDIVHFGCHGIYNEVYPLYSSLVITPTNGPPREDAFLEAREMANFRIRANLVVLGACDTGRGEIVRGQGLIGMTWAVFAGGGRACIASRWQVDDPATARLFDVFYRQLKQGKSKADALRLAQLSLLRSSGNTGYSHPYYWAGVMLLGV